jgi:hypothetical protein
MGGQRRPREDSFPRGLSLEPVSHSLNCCYGKFIGQWLRLYSVSLFKPFYFCIKGREGFFFLSYIYTSQIRKCPNQIGGQVASATTAQNLFFFFFHFFLKPPYRRKINKMSVGCFVHRANNSFNSEKEKQKIGLRTKVRNRKWYVSTYSGAVLFS